MTCIDIHVLSGIAVACQVSSEYSGAAAFVLLRFAESAKQILG